MMSEPQLIYSKTIYSIEICWNSGMLEYWNIGYKCGKNLFIKLIEFI